MKKFIVNILFFFGIVAFIDFVAGKVFWHLQTKSGGRTGAEYYACKESNEDVIIMGSSRASHHYVPQIIMDSLGLSCFNAGQDGNGIILQYGRWKMISERYTPKMIIYDVNPSFDLNENDNMAYMDRLKPYSRDGIVKDYIVSVFPMERVKLLSQMYRYNYKFIEMISDSRTEKDFALRGYIPLNGIVREEIKDRVNDEPRAISELKYDGTKLYYLELLAKECQQKGTKLVIVVSPFFAGGGYNEHSFYPVLEIANKYGFAFFYQNETDMCQRPEMFKDSYHLNNLGALTFTRELVSCLK